MHHIFSYISLCKVMPLVQQKLIKWRSLSILLTISLKIWNSILSYFETEKIKKRFPPFLTSSLPPPCLCLTLNRFLHKRTSKNVPNNIICLYSYCLLHILEIQSHLMNEWRQTRWLSGGYWGKSMCLGT